MSYRHVIPLADPHTRPVTVVLVMSPGHEERAQWFKQATEGWRLDIHTVMGDPYSYDTMHSIVSRVVQEYGHIVMNVTEGTKLMALAAFDVCHGHPLFAFLEAVPDLKNKTIAEVLNRLVESLVVWRTDTDGSTAYAAAEKTHHADHEVTFSDDPDASHVLRWINTTISNAKAMIDGTFHGRGRTRCQLYLDEFIYRFNRRHFGTRIADRLLMACLGTPLILMARNPEGG